MGGSGGAYDYAYAYFTYRKPYAARTKRWPTSFAVDREGKCDPRGELVRFILPTAFRLGDKVRVIILNDEASAKLSLAAVQTKTSGPSMIWLWRRTSDVSRGGSLPNSSRI